MPRKFAVATLAVALAACAGRRPFPEAPILIVCPWAAGGGSDRVARQLAVLLEQELRVPVNVINATGGDGVTGHSRGALARADGYTLTLLTIEVATLHWRGMTTIAPADFAPVALVNRDAGAIFVRNDAPWRTLADLERAIREKPRSLRASGTATAGIWHLALAGWLSGVGLASTDVIWVSIAGAAPSLQELLAGGIDVVSCSLPEAQAMLSAGRIRSLGVMADARQAQFPDIPTFREQGVDWTLGTLRGLGAPKDTPPDRLRAIRDAVARVVQGDAYRNAMTQAGFSPEYEDGARFAATLDATDRRLGALLASPGFKNLAAKQVGPYFFPGLLGVALALVSLGLVFRVGDASRDEVSSVAAPAGANTRSVEVLLWVVSYLALAETLGFVLTAGGLLLVHLLRLGTRPRVAVLLTLLLVPLAYQLFAVLLRVPLPRGLLGW